MHINSRVVVYSNKNSSHFLFLFDVYLKVHFLLRSFPVFVKMPSESTKQADRDEERLFSMKCPEGYFDHHYSVEQNCIRGFSSENEKKIRLFMTIIIQEI